MNDKEALQEALAVADALSGEVDALRKQASEALAKQAAAPAVTPAVAEVFTKEALAQTADALIDAGFAKSAQKEAFIDLFVKNPAKILETVQTIAKQAGVAKAPAAAPLVPSGSLCKSAAANGNTPAKANLDAPFNRYLRS